MKKILLLLLLIGCNETSREQFRKENFPTVKEEASQIRYYKDSRTNLCFAASQVGEYPTGTATVFANVPCSPAVEELIK